MLSSNNVHAYNVLGTAPTVGRITAAALIAYNDAGNLIKLGNFSEGGNRSPRVIFQYASDEANDQARTITVHAVHKADVGPVVDSYDVRLLGTIAVTLGTCTGLSGSSVLTDSFLLADTYGAWSVNAAYGAMLQNLLDAAFAVSSPANNTPGAAGVSDLAGAVGLLISVASLGAGKTAKVLAEAFV